jgi:hypothetical protein
MTPSVIGYFHRKGLQEFLMSKAQMIRRFLKEKGQLIMPGVYDALSAKIASKTGFEVIFITGYSLAAPDLFGDGCPGDRRCGYRVR